MSVVQSGAPTHDAAMIEQAFARCRDITRLRARNFHYGIRLSPEPQRGAIYAVYAWMRLADDLVDSCNAREIHLLESRIGDFRAHTDAAIAGRPSDDDPFWLALAETSRRFNLSPQHFHHMLDGQMDDAHRTSYDTYERLVDYCRKVASTVGLLCIEIWGYADPRAPALAAERGIAFQLTNILRDVAEDYDIGRVYLPQEDFARAGISPADLRQWTSPDACRRVLRCTIDRAAEAYARSSPLDEMIGSSGRPTLWAMTTIYRRLLEKIAADPHQVAIGPRVRVSALHKGAIALRAKWLARFVTDQANGSSPSQRAKASV